MLFRAQPISQFGRSQTGTLHSKGTKMSSGPDDWFLQPFS